MKIRHLKEILNEKQEYKPAWTVDNNVLANPKFGSVEQICVCDDSGKPIWDQYQIRENKGAIVVPYYKMSNPDNEEIFLGLIECKRPIPEGSDKKQGIISIEFPRGVANKCEDFEDAARRELLEETGNNALNITKIGNINPNTAFYVTSIPVYQVEIDINKKNAVISDGLESISKSEYYTVQEVIEKVNDGKIICGLTKAALMHFIAKNNLFKK